MRNGLLQKEAALDALVPDSQVAFKSKVMLMAKRKGFFLSRKIKRTAQSNYVAVAKMIENLDKILEEAQALQMETGSEFLADITEPAQGMKQALIQAFEQLV